ncbi:MAG TPA: FliM/FliN family flagellar motor switch protein [Fibrobacteraceae bacterium]|nr:FliM/FliN family flagellar motor switch protein [Fibrobacteraceae bacterium]
MSELREYRRSSRKQLDIDQLQDVHLPASMVLGYAHTTIHDLLDLQPGSILSVDRVAGENVDLVVNGKTIAKGEVVVMNNLLSFRLVNLLSPEERLKTI